MNFISLKIKEITGLLVSRYYRQYLLLILKYGKEKRNQKREVTFLNYRINVPDSLSFIFQYKEIFVKNIYRFNSGTNDPLILDCGANIGMSCLYFKSLFPNSIIKAFEADPEIAGILKKNMEMNSITGVEVIPKVVWIDNDGVQFSSDGADGGSIYGEFPRKKLESVRLKDILDKAGDISMLKVDIEGAEIDVFNDCGESLRKAENIFVEFHSWKGQKQRLDELLSVLSKYGFRYFLENITRVESPFSENEAINNSDLQINIFAVRI